MDAPLAAKAALLQALAEPGFGLDLIQRIHRRTAGAVSLKPGSVYPALRALERGGLVKGQEVVEGRGRPRRYYELTLKGVRAAMTQRKALTRFLGTGGPLPSAAQIALMGERLRTSVEVSGFVRSLREGLVRAEGRR